MPFPQCFVSFHGVMQACLGSTLDESYENKISQFEDAYKALNISMTTKVHIMIKHVPEFIQQHGKPLGQFSQQVVEQCHAKFNKFSIIIV